MQDRYKFRAIKMETKEVVYIDNFYWFEEEGVCEIDHNNTGSGSFAEYWINQCTGKKDKHNKLIYEGDIVRLTAKNKMTFEYVVKYRLSEYRYVLEYANGKLKGHKARDFSKEYAQVKNLYEGGYEVIGNIYENPELLEDNK